MAGLEAELTSRGVERFGGAAFLSLWLCFWVVGEVLAVGLLVAGAWALVTGQPLGEGRKLLATGPALLTGVFLLCWVTFWTFGGLMAWHEFFRLLWSRDRLVARGDGLEVANRVGPIVKRRFLPADTLRGFFRIAPQTAVQAETTTGVVELTRNGTPAEQAQLIAALAAEFKLPAPDRLPAVLPAAWCEVRAPEGGEVVVRDPAPRRTAARIMWLIALPLTWAAIAVARETWSDLNLGAAAAILATLAGFALWGAVRLTWTREEWRPERGGLVVQRRSGPRRRELFSGDTLRLVEGTDSDGDSWYRLELGNAAGRSRLLKQAMHDPTEPRQLGRWLASRTGLTLDYRATPEAIERAEAERAALQDEQIRHLRKVCSQWLRSLPGFGRRE
jgi:hypothetical protein